MLSRGSNTGMGSQIDLNKHFSIISQSVQQGGHCRRRHARRRSSAKRLSGQVAGGATVDGEAPCRLTEREEGRGGRKQLALARSPDGAAKITPLSCLVTHYIEEGWTGLDRIGALHTTRANYDGSIMYYVSRSYIQQGTKRARKTGGAAVCPADSGLWRSHSRHSLASLSILSFVK